MNRSESSSSKSCQAESLVGILLAIVSLIVMPALAWQKRKVADQIHSRALAADALETLACSYLSLTLLLGLGLNAALGWWWADPLAALAMVVFLVREGWETIQEGWTPPERTGGLGVPVSVRKKQGEK
jgi:divalent metal cation (Fe/Co/Zn/Cd) transporter